MKFALKPLHSLLLAGLLATLGAAAVAQPALPSAAPTAAASSQASAAAQAQHTMRHDPVRRQAMLAQRQSELKDKLKITPAQENAWTTYSASWQRPAAAAGRSDRAELAKLPTPERIDKMRALRTQRMTDMNAYLDQRGEATKALYAALSPEQQKVLDANFSSRGGHAGKFGRHHQPG